MGPVWALLMKMFSQSMFWGPHLRKAKISQRRAAELVRTWNRFYKKQEDSQDISLCSAQLPTPSESAKGRSIPLTSYVDAGKPLNITGLGFLILRAGFWVSREQFIH